MKAVIYARVSSTTDRQSTERQVKDLTEYANYQKYEIARVFEEKISGAKKNSDRAVLQDAIDHCISNKIDMLLCRMVHFGSKRLLPFVTVFGNKRHSMNTRKKGL